MKYTLIIAFGSQVSGKTKKDSDFDFIRFKVKAWKVYQDTAKFRRLGEQMVKKYVKGIHS